ncbi:hypothetical protein F3Y22_tig00111338pilonHSYRG00324 [Hibiscus syriacus]|uniref:Uncharacterized protein n=1 Tax=Hibiscus syriacus TaxID=106335 RepID=A0A6A2YPM2_HIBSY|nr:hypothetical protein F3Y22_tig00111338pilonHSYRG00324 [Hibiscus syriacus]
MLNVAGLLHLNFATAHDFLQAVLLLFSAGKAKLIFIILALLGTCMPDIETQGMTTSNSTAMGLSSSRISPETSGRGHGFYNSEYRSFKRGFGSGQSHRKSFQSHPPSSREGTDIFMEAGRLAAEYLVSQGLLPPSVLPAKWQSGRLKKQTGEYHLPRLQVPRG